MKIPTNIGSRFRLPMAATFLTALSLQGGVTLFAQSPAATGRPATAADEAIQLKPFSVVEEKSGGYRVSSASAATRTNTALIDIPQTVDIVTSELWNDIGATTFDESFRYVPNVYVRNRHAGSGDGVNLRGFVTTSSMTVDGVRMGNHKRDLVGYDRLEVVKGPPSAVQGRAGGTGLLNYILKKPVLGERSFTGRATFGFDENDRQIKRAEFDANYSFNPAKTVAVRVTGSKENSDDYIKFGKSDNLSLYPSVRWQITRSTELVATGEFLELDTPSREEGHGFALYPEVLRRLVPQFNTDRDPITALGLPYDFNVTGPGNSDKEWFYGSSVFLTHQFTPKIFYRQVASWHYLSSDSITFTNGDNFNVANRASSRLKNQDYRHGFVAQGDFVVKYSWRNVFTASTMLGWAYAKTHSISDAYSGVPERPFNALNLAEIKASGYSAAYFAPRTVLNLPRTTYNGTESYSIGKYVEHDVGFFRERLILSGGIRSDRDHSDTTNLVTQRPTAGTDTNLNSFRYGATFKVLPKLALYVVKSVQNDPTRTTARYSRLLAGDPRLNEFFTVSPQTDLREIGVKTELLRGRVTLTADYWEMKRTGATVAVTFIGLSQGQNVSINRNEEIAAATSKGCEFSFFGSLTDKFNVIANFTTMQTSQQRPGSVNPADLVSLPFAPGWNANFFGKYSFRDRNEQGWIVKGGIAIIGPYYHMVTGITDLTLIPHRQESIDVGAAYRWKKYEFDVTINNLTNDPFMITRDQAPRTYRFSVATRF
ncbi:MAG: hypothetical protein EXS37_11670 [Opitutus sp.]|nr:hypothetical protein [Opitutus sp.]